eukprot:GHRR01012141.1.p1 GENE.GHRR01012141.1~~GHRR01012141.1.p1  ORF type:complete len:217 (+),score=72.96 GHRR01012141.1:182-832(+)
MCWRIAQHRTQEPDNVTPTILLVGMESAGKSLLLQKLSAYCKAKASGTSHTATSAPATPKPTSPTLGTELVQLPAVQRLLSTPLMIREVGGQMRPIWHNYYSEAVAVVFVVDAAAPSALAEATMELFELLQHPTLHAKPLCVVLSKCDAPSRLSRGQLDAAMRLHDLQLQHPGRLHVQAASAATGAGVRQLTQWLAAVVLTAPGVRNSERGSQRKN